MLFGFNHPPKIFIRQTVQILHLWVYRQEQCFFVFLIFQVSLQQSYIQILIFLVLAFSRARFIQYADHSAEYINYNHSLPYRIYACHIKREAMEGDCRRSCSASTQSPGGVHQQCRLWQGGRVFNRVLHSEYHYMYCSVWEGYKHWQAISMAYPILA